MTIDQLSKTYQAYISNLEHNIQGLNGNSHQKIQAETQLTAYKEFLNELGQLSIAQRLAGWQSAGVWKPGEMTKDILISIFKTMSLIDLSECEFDYWIVSEMHCINATQNGVVKDAIAYDGNIFHMMDNDGSMHPLNPMSKAFEHWESLQPATTGEGTAFAEWAVTMCSDIPRSVNQSDPYIWTYAGKDYTTAELYHLFTTSPNATERQEGEEENN